MGCIIPIIHSVRTPSFAAVVDFCCLFLYVPIEKCQCNRNRWIYVYFDLNNVHVHVNVNVCTAIQQNWTHSRTHTHIHVKHTHTHTDLMYNVCVRAYSMTATHIKFILHTNNQELAQWEDGRKKFEIVHNSPSKPATVAVAASGNARKIIHGILYLFVI